MYLYRRLGQHKHDGDDGRAGLLYNKFYLYLYRFTFIHTLKYLYYDKTECF